MSGHTKVQAVSKDGEQFTVQHTESDSPILPAPNLEHLQRIDPSLVPFVVEQTKIEADFRRSQNKKVNLYIFIERISGVLVGGGIALVGLGLGAYLILAGHDWAGTAICGINLVGIVSVIVTRKISKEDNPSSQNTSPKKTSRRR